MRILMVNRPDAFDLRGGDTVQMEATAERLRALGVSVDLSSETTPPLDGYDLVHVFNLSRPDSASMQARHAHAAGKPYVLTPIDIDLNRYDRDGRAAGLRLLYRALPKHWLNAARSWHLQRPHLEADRAWIVRHAKVVLPNSDVEGEQLQRKFDFPGRMVTIPYGVSLEPTPDRPRDGILCAARIEPLKNQLRLIRALAGSGIRVKLAGALSPKHPRWARRCLTELHDAGGEYLGELGRDDLVRAYAASKVHALPSWFETVGLASLEAAWHGCRIVAGNIGYAHAYLGADASYCDPRHERSIRRAVETALAAPPPTELRERIAREFTWDVSARRTFDVYRMVLENSSDL